MLGLCHALCQNATMPKGKQPIDSRILEAIPRIRAVMVAQGHRQQDVEKITNVPQYQISRILKGKRARMSPAIEALCRYANIEIDTVRPASSAEQRVSRAVRQALADNPHGAEVLARIIEALTPALALLRDAPAARADKELP